MQVRMVKEEGKKPNRKMRQTGPKTFYWCHFMWGKNRSQTNCKILVMLTSLKNWNHIFVKPEPTQILLVIHKNCSRIWQKWGFFLRWQECHGTFVIQRFSLKKGSFQAKNCNVEIPMGYWNEQHSVYFRGIVVCSLQLLLSFRYKKCYIKT